VVKTGISKINKETSLLKEQMQNEDVSEEKKRDMGLLLDIVTAVEKFIQPV
jgi:hypothetical protein